MQQLFEFFERIIDVSDWPARWHCGLWSDAHGWVYIFSDLTIWLAYMAIPLILIRFVLVKKGVPLPGVFWLFGAFIMLCGLTHLIDALMFWYPAYRLNTLIRSLTGIVSVFTVIALARYFNEAVGLRTSKEYEQESWLRQQALNELTRSNQELQQFAYVASHDLQSPLKTISNYLTLLENKHADQLGPDASRLITVSTAAAERMRNLISDLLEFSRVGSDIAFMDVNLQELVSEILEEQQAEIQATNASVISDPLPTILGHRTDLKQVFQNLISNALKYRRAEVAPIITVRFTNQPDRYRFAVSDNGIGIDAQYFERIFRIFQRLHGRNEYSGTGIGLATCKKIVSIYGGDIWLESTLGTGTTIYFTIAKDIKTVHQYAQPNAQYVAV